MINYLTLGYDCSTATALRHLNLRNYALPFDWVVSEKQYLCDCINNDFMFYHTELKLSENKTRLIDYYGFQFPHDYPTTKSDYDLDEYGEDIIVDNWIDYHQKVLDKYSRRIERFIEIVNSKNPIIALYRGKVEDAISLKELLINKYKIATIKFVVASKEKDIPNYDDIFLCDPEINGEWNDIEIWNKTINIAIQSI